MGETLNNPSDSTEAWDEQRIAQLILFAEATPDQKLDWLEQVFSIFSPYLPNRDA